MSAPSPALLETAPYTSDLLLSDATTIPEMIEQRADSKLGVTLVNRYLEETPLPYPMLARGARRAAARLAGEGVRPGDRVALISSTSPQFLVCLFGVWRAGAIPVVLPLPHRLFDLADAHRELAGRIAFADCSCVVVADVFAASFQAGDLGLPVLTCGELVAHRGSEAPPCTVGPDDLAYLQFTSGTTGMPRAVALTHRQILANITAIWAGLRDDLGDHLVHVSWLPLFHDLGLMTAVGAIWMGGRLILIPPEEFMRRPDCWVDALSKYRAISTWAPNFAYALATRSMATRPRDLDLSALQFAGDGAEPVRLDVLDEFVATGARYGLRPEAMAPMYGLAEATVGVTVSEMSKPALRDVVSRSHLEEDKLAVPTDPEDPGARTLAICGRPIPGVRVRIVDEHTERPLGERHVGEICVQGPSLMRAYWRDEQATAAALRDGWLHTGDLGYLVPEGLVVCGRIKDMIIIGGRNLYPEDYEYVCGTVGGLRRVSAAFVVPGTERVVVALEPGQGNADHQRLADEAMNRLRDRLGHAPDQVVVVKRGSIPLTSSGKVQRGRCRALYFADELPVLAKTDR